MAGAEAAAVTHPSTPPSTKAIADDPTRSASSWWRHASRDANLPRAGVSRVAWTRSTLARFCAAFFACAAVAFANGVAAQPSTPASEANPAPSGIVPPAPAQPIDVLYPDGASGENVVLLHLLVTAEGAVGEAVAVSGDEPFATVAREAALTWRFTPATRDGKPVAARIRFEVRFVPPPPPEPEVPPPPAPPSGTAVGQPATPEPPKVAPQPAPKAPITVFVIGDKPPPSAKTFTRAEVRQLPGAFGDPFRAIEAMPGVTPMVSGAPFFFVRGAPPGNVGYFLDGIRVPLLYHVALGPSVIHPAIVSRVDLHAGGYPAQFGRFTGGIVAAETTPPPVELRGEGSIRLVDAGLLVEDAWSQGRTTATVGGRYSYTAAVLSVLSPEVVLEYWDYQLRAGRKLNDRDSVGVFSFGAYDYLGEERGEKTETIFGSQFHRLDLRFDHDPSEREHLRAAVMIGVDRTDGEDESDIYLQSQLAGARVEWKKRPLRDVLIHAGADMLVERHDVVPPDADEVDDDEEREERDQFGRLFPSRTDFTTGAYASAVLDLGAGVSIAPGLRSDLYHSEGTTAVGVDPRMSAQFAIHERVKLDHTVGVVHQPPAFSIPVPGFQVAGLEDGLQRAVQSSAAVHVELPQDVTASATLFQSTFFNMSDALGAIRAETGDFGDNLEKRSIGRTYGLEVYVRRRLSRRFGGFLSYTLSRSTRSFGRTHIAAAFDRTHVLNLAAAYELGRLWRAGTRFTYYSGFPGELTDSARARGREPERAPGFYRLDLRLEKRWRINDQGAWWALVFEVLNATLHKEVVDYECSVDDCHSEEIGPVTIPSIGAEVAF